MIGEKYWATGIVIQAHEAEGEVLWSAKASFFDDGFCDDDSTEGTLHSRYGVADLTRVLDVLIADAAKLGIVFERPSGGPHIYYTGDGEHEGVFCPANWREICNAQAARLGWEPTYKETP